MKLSALEVLGKAQFNRFSRLCPHALSAYAFQTHLLWRRHYRLRQARVGSALCIFYEDALGCFMNCPPLSKAPDASVIETCFALMNSANKNPAISRIENIEEDEAQEYHRLGFEIREKFPEYVCATRDIALLRGDRYKSQRANVNYFEKNFSYKVTEYAPRWRAACLDLYRHWMKQRKETHQDPVYRGMLEDSARCFEAMLGMYRRAGFEGMLVIVDGKARGMTFGYELSEHMFCIAFEVADLSIKGLAQFIFRRFCKELIRYRYMNIMDDSGIENLRRTKLAYHPEKQACSFIATQPIAHAQ